MEPSEQFKAVEAVSNLSGTILKEQEIEFAHVKISTQKVRWIQNIINLFGEMFNNNNERLAISIREPSKTNRSLVSCY